VGLTSVTTEVAEGAIIGDDKDDVGLRGGRDGEKEEKAKFHVL
jgi:hypothetical protein